MTAEFRQMGKMPNFSSPRYWVDQAKAGSDGTAVRITANLSFDEDAFNKALAEYQARLDEELRAQGYERVFQVHDEVIYRRKDRTMTMQRCAISDGRYFYYVDGYSRWGRYRGTSTPIIYCMIENAADAVAWGNGRVQGGCHTLPGHELHDADVQMLPRIGVYDLPGYHGRLVVVTGTTEILRVVKTSGEAAHAERDGIGYVYTDAPNVRTRTYDLLPDAAWCCPECCAAEGCTHDDGCRLRPMELPRFQQVEAAPCRHGIRGECHLCKNTDGLLLQMTEAEAREYIDRMLGMSRRQLMDIAKPLGISVVGRSAALIRDDIAKSIDITDAKVVISGARYLDELLAKVQAQPPAKKSPPYKLALPLLRLSALGREDLKDEHEYARQTFGYNDACTPPASTPLTEVIQMHASEKQRENRKQASAVWSAAVRDNLAFRAKQREVKVQTDEDEDTLNFGDAL